MGCCTKTCLMLTSAVVVAIAVYVMMSQSTSDPPEVGNNKWFGSLPKPAAGSVDESIRKFKIDIHQLVLDDLYQRLNRSRISGDLDGSLFQYGINLNYLKEVLQHWRTKYDWRIHEKKMNVYPQYKTNIDGVDVHYVHITSGKADAVPLMLVHGWPGSFYEFYRAIPKLLESDVTFDLVIPAIPGYGFSEAAKQTGFDVSSAGRVFHTLMSSRLRYKQYYLQGGDWGSAITSTMAQMYPDSVHGLHINMIISASPALSSLVNRLLYYAAPSMYLDEYQQQFVKSFYEFLKFGLLETGYFHLQATKPNTPGVALNDSPLGLAAYLLEKFSTWTDPSGVNLADGGLADHHDIDDLLTNIMIYWTTGSITSSMRLYKEFIISEEDRARTKFPITVPTGLAYYRHEPMNVPDFVAKQRYHHVVHVSYIDNGGHFAAFERPQEYADDVIAFIKKLRK